MAFDEFKGDFAPLVRMVHNHAKNRPTGVAMRQKEFGIWNEITWEGLQEIMQATAAGLVDLGLNTGDHVGILSENRSEWVQAQFGINAAAGVVVGMYPTSPAAELEHLVNASDSTVLFIEDQEQLDKIKELGDRVPQLRQLVIFNPKGTRGEDLLGLISFDDLLKRGRARLSGLADDLRATRQHILRAHLAADFEVAFDAMLYALCEQALGRSYNNEALDISIRPFQAQDREVLHADTVAQKMLEALEQDLATDWMKLEKPEDFRVMSALPLADKQALFAWATGLAVKPQLSSDNRPSPIIEEIGARLDVDVAACWRPTAQNYWGRVNKGHAVATALKLISEDYAEDRNRERKGDIAAAMERAFAETADETEGFGAATVAKTTRWLPDGMAFAGAMDADADMGDDVPEAEEGDQPASDTQIDAENDEPSSLPAFLSGDAA